MYWLDMHAGERMSDPSVIIIHIQIVILLSIILLLGTS